MLLWQSIVPSLSLGPSPYLAGLIQRSLGKEVSCLTAHFPLINVFEEKYIFWHFHNNGLLACKHYEPYTANPEGWLKSLTK